MIRILAQTGQVKDVPLKTLKLLIFHIAPIISASVAELCRRAAEFLLSCLQLLSRSRSLFFFFSSTLHMHLCGKHSSANGDMCEIQLRTCCGCTLCNPGRLRGSSSQEATLQATSKQKSQWPGPLPGAGHVPSHSPPTLREQLVVTHHHTRSSLISLGLTRYTQVSPESNAHCWTLLSIIHVLLLK